MKKFLVIAGLVLAFTFVAFAGSADAQVSCQQIGNQTYCSNGQTFQQIGPNIYDNRGNSWQQIGPNTYGSDGTVCQQIGSMTFCN